jgi:hypothetical protein
MNQGALGDCYFIAALGSIADANASDITSMITINGDNTWTVRFYKKEDGKFTASYVTVDNQLPVDGGLLVYAGQGDDPDGADDSELWMPLLEKAYAQWNELGFSGQPRANTYAAIEGGDTAVASEQILGIGVSKDVTKLALDGAIAKNDPVTFGTHQYADYLVPLHAYVITDDDSSTGSYTLYNPHDGSSPIYATWGVLVNDGDYYTHVTSSDIISLNTPLFDAKVLSGFVPAGSATAVFAALSASQTAGRSGHDGLSLKATESSSSDLDTFQYDRIDAALAADLSGRAVEESLDHFEETWAISSDRLDRNSASEAIDMLFSDMKASLVGKLLPEWDIDLPEAG